MPERKTIVWDWNGTLFDDVSLCVEVCGRLLQSHGCKPLSGLEEYRQIFGFPVEQFYLRMGLDFSKAPFSVLAEEYMADYQPKSDDCPLQKGAEETLRSLWEDGYEQVLLSASRIDHLNRQLSRHAVREVFSEVLGITDIYAKSKLCLAQDWLEQGKSGAGRILFVGDTLHDAEIARTLGCSCILLDRGHQSRERLEGSGFPVVSELMEVRNLVR